MPPEMKHIESSRHGLIIGPAPSRHFVHRPVDDRGTSSGQADLAQSYSSMWSSQHAACCMCEHSYISIMF